MPNDNYTEVTCIVEVPKRPLYKVGSKYSSKSSSNDNGILYWVGIPGEGGHNFTQADFKFHFE